MFNFSKSFDGDNFFLLTDIGSLFLNPRVTYEVLFLAFGPAFILTALGLITGGILAWGIGYTSIFLFCGFMIGLLPGCIFGHIAATQTSSDKRLSYSYAAGGIVGIPIILIGIVGLIYKLITILI